MKSLKIATVLPLLLLVSGVLMGATQYGAATLEEGSMSIVREGQTLNFNRVRQVVPVNEEDLLRVRPGSRVVLKSRENATMTLGSNAVFHVKPWRAKGKTGFVRALFGRFRASIVGLVGGESFNVKTATATIGVKGTEYLTAITSRGSTMVITTDHDPEVQGQSGPPVNVLPQFITVVINDRRATYPVNVPPDILQEFLDTLNSPPPNTRGGRNMPGEQSLKDNGIASEDDLDEGKGDDSGDPTTQLTLPENPEILIIVDPNEGSGAAERGNVRLDFQ